MDALHLLTSLLSVGLLAAVLLLECRFLFAKKAFRGATTVGWLLGSSLFFAFITAGFGHAISAVASEGETLWEHRNAGWFFVGALCVALLTLVWNSRSRTPESGMVYALALALAAVAVAVTLKVAWTPSPNPKSAALSALTPTPIPSPPPLPTPLPTAPSTPSPTPRPETILLPVPTITPTPQPTLPPTPDSSPTPERATIPKATPTPTPLVTAEQRMSAAMDILQTHCVSCHGPDKQKGSYRVDLPRPARGGGVSNETAIIPGAPGAGTFLQRVSLPRDDIDAMPPEPEKGLTQPEIALLTRWIEEGARFPGEPENAPRRDPFLQDIITALRDRGWAADYVPWDTNRLLIDVSATDTPEMETFAEATRPLAPKLVWLNGSNHRWPTDFFELLPAFTELQRLHLAKTNITDQDLMVLLALPKLEYLNLNQTAITPQGLATLASRHPSLKRVYLFGTNLSPATIRKFQEEFPTISFIGIPSEEE